MKEQVIHLSSHDDVDTVRDRIGRLQADRVLLVFPQTGDPPKINSLLHLRLIHRQTSVLGAHLGIVTRNDKVCDLAQALRIPVFNAVEDSHALRWRSRLPQWRNWRSENPSNLLFPPTIRKTRKPLPRWLTLPLRVGLFAVAVLAVCVLIALVLPSATLTIHPIEQPVQAELTFLLDSNRTQSDFLAGELASQLATVELADQVEVATTGSIEVGTARASGEVTFTNRTDRQVIVPAGSAVRSSDSSTPQRFVTQATAIIPAGTGSLAVVPILAVNAGPAGNVAAGRINRLDGALGEQVNTLNLRATTGGETITAPAVALADVERATQQLLTRLQETAQTALQGQLQAEQTLLLETLQIEVLASTPSHFSGEQADRLGLEMRVQVSAVVQDAAQIRQAVLANLQAQAGEQWVLPETLQVEELSAPQVQANRQVRLSLRAQAQSTPQFNTAQIQQVARWQAVTTLSAQMVALDPNISAADLAFSPAFLNQLPAPLQSWLRTPWLAWRIRVQVAE
ncbi:MAG TPA: hypothetical protein PK299_11640 [Anaerolineales bacterium]|nr:hypothetical protein [Anaerolineales bacterium]